MNAERQAAAQRSTWVSVGVNLLLTVLQIVVGLGTKSQALVADGIHSLSDLASDVIVLVANQHSHKAADDDHPYGHQRFETAATLALSLLMISVGLGLLWAAIGKLQAPADLTPGHPAALGIALVTLAAKEALFRYLLRVGERVKSSLLVANAWHSRSDAASSLVVALGIGGSVMGFPLLDPIAAVIVGLMIVRMGWQFGRQSLDTLMDRAADAEEVSAIRQTLAGTPGARGVHDVRTRKMGDLILVDAHLEVDAHISVEAGHAITEEAERRVLQRHRVLDVLIHVDPYHASSRRSTGVASNPCEPPVGT